MSILPRVVRREKDKKKDKGKDKDKDDTVYQSYVRCNAKGDFVMPVEVEDQVRQRREIREHWME